MRQITATFVFASFGIIAQTGVVSAQEPFLGEVRLIATNFAPRGWQYCTGQMIPSRRNHIALERLFSSFRNNSKYGGDGRSYFCLPDMSKVEADMKKVCGVQSVPRFIIYPRGAFPYKDGAVFGGGMVGEIRLFAGDFAPSGWAFCDGRKIANTDNPALFSMTGTRFGGDRTHFRLPDLRDLESRWRKLSGGKNVPRHIVCLRGLVSTKKRGNGEGLLGEVRMFCTQRFAPRGWMFCQNQTMIINSNAALFSLLGTRFGGDGRRTYQLPDLSAYDQLTAKLSGCQKIRPFTAKPRRVEGDFAPRRMIAVTGIFPSRN